MYFVPLFLKVVNKSADVIRGIRWTKKRGAMLAEGVDEK